MSVGSKNPDFRMSTYDVLKHGSWRKEWLMLGCPKDEQSSSHGNGG